MYQYAHFTCFVVSSYYCFMWYFRFFSLLCKWILTSFVFFFTNHDMWTRFNRFKQKRKKTQNYNWELLSWSSKHYQKSQQNDGIFFIILYAFVLMQANKLQLVNGVRSHVVVILNGKFDDDEDQVVCINGDTKWPNIIQCRLIVC